MTMTNLANEVTCINVVLVCLLIRKLLASPVAWLGAGLLAVDPFYISHSPVVTPDGLLASFDPVHPELHRHRFGRLSGAWVTASSPGGVLPRIGSFMLSFPAG
jgi:hypothetical protein